MRSSRNITRHTNYFSYFSAMKSFCKECESPLKGRMDKKFCNDYCRASYHSRQNRASNQTIRLINRCLRRNRKILEDYYLKNGPLVNQNYLLSQNFNFTFCTHHIDETRMRHYYDYAIQPTDSVNYEIIRAEE